MDKLPKPICQICGLESKRFDGVVLFMHYGIFCFDCLAKYEKRFLKLCKEVVKEEIEKIKLEKDLEKNNVQEKK